MHNKCRGRHAKARRGLPTNEVACDSGLPLFRCGFPFRACVGFGGLHTIGNGGHSVLDHNVGADLEVPDDFAIRVAHDSQRSLPFWTTIMSLANSSTGPVEGSTCPAKRTIEWFRISRGRLIQ